MTDFTCRPASSRISVTFNSRQTRRATEWKCWIKVRLIEIVEEVAVLMPKTILKIDIGGGATKVDNWAAAAMMILAASPLARLFRKAPEGLFKLGMGTLSISAALTQKLIRNQFCKLDARWMRWSERGGINFWLVKAVRLFKKRGCRSLQLSI